MGCNCFGFLLQANNIKLISFSVVKKKCGHKLIRENASIMEMFEQFKTCEDFRTFGRSVFDTLSKTYNNIEFLFSIQPLIQR